MYAVFVPLQNCQAAIIDSIRCAMDGTEHHIFDIDGRKY